MVSVSMTVFLLDDPISTRFENVLAHHTISVLIRDAPFDIQGAWMVSEEEKYPHLDIYWCTPYNIIMTYVT